MRRRFKGRFDIALPLDFSEAEQVFALARFPERGKPLVGAATRLERDERTGDLYVSYRDTPVVTMHADGTYTLDHGGYPTRPTAGKMEMYAPVESIGLQGEYRWHSTYSSPEPFHAWDNLMLHFSRPAGGRETAEDLRYQWYPERFKITGSLPFPRERLRIDAQGRPVLVDLLADLAPPEWGHLLGGRVQAWTDATRHHWDDLTPLPLQHRAAYTTAFADDGGTHELLLYRPRWTGEEPVATVWAHDIVAGPRVYRWVVFKRPGHLGERQITGTRGSLDAAVAEADRVLTNEHWSSQPPRLTEVLGNLRDQLRGPRRGQQPLPFSGGAALLETPVVRVHWQEPWMTFEGEVVPGELSSLFTPVRELYSLPDPVILPRQPLPGSQSWTGPEDVRVWFELVDGTAVGILHNSDTDLDELVVRRLRGPQKTAWDTPGILAAGLLAAVAAALLGG